MTITAHFDPQANSGLGQAGYLATTPSGITRFGTTAAEAERRALAQEAAYGLAEAVAA